MSAFRDWSEWEAYQLDQPNLSPNQIDKIKTVAGRKPEEENARVRERVAEERYEVYGRVNDHYDGVKAMCEEAQAALKQANERRLTAQELGKVREKVRRLITALEGDGQKRQGVLASLDSTIAYIESAEKDPQPVISELYRKFPAAGDRFRITRWDLR